MSPVAVGVTVEKVTAEVVGYLDCVQQQVHDLPQSAEVHKGFFPVQESRQVFHQNESERWMNKLTVEKLGSQLKVEQTTSKTKNKKKMSVN